MLPLLKHDDASVRRAAIQALGNTGDATAAKPLAEVLGNADSDATEAFERMQKHLATNEIKLDKDKAVLGPWLTIDHRKERFKGPFAEQANKLLKREQYRAPFVVPEKV